MTTFRYKYIINIMSDFIMDIEGIKITKNDINKLNEEGAIYTTKKTEMKVNQLMPTLYGLATMEICS